MKKVSKILSIVSVAAFMLTSLFGCGSDSNKPGTSTQATTQEVKEKVLKTGVINDPDNLCFLFTTRSATCDITNFINAGLLKYDKDYKLVPYMAESYEISNDKKTLTFKLRKNIKWSDGQPLTSADVKYSFELSMDPKIPVTQTYWIRPTVEKVEAPDDYTVILTLKKPDSTIMEYLTAPFIMPKHIWEKEDRTNLNKSKYVNEPIGCGPFKFVEWKKGERIVLEKNPDFFYSDVKLDKVVFEVAGAESTAYAKMQKGEWNYGRIAAKDEDLFAQIQDMKLVPVKMTSFNFIMYNTKTVFFSDKKVRQAIAYAVDKDAFINGLEKGKVNASDTSYPPGHPVHNPNVKKYPNDVEVAKKLLDETGWKIGKDGIREKDGKKFSVKLYGYADSLAAKNCAVLLQSQLKPIGINVEIQMLDQNSVMENFVLPGKFDMLLESFSLGGNDQSVFYHSNPQIGQGNWGKYENPEMDKLWDRAKAEFDFNKQKELYGQIQQMLAEDQPFLILYSAPQIYAMKKNVQPSFLDFYGEFEPFNFDIK